MTDLLLALLLTTLGLPLVDNSNSTNMVSSIQSFASQFATGAATVLGSVDTVALQIMRALYVTLLVVGVLLYFSHANRRLGKDFMSGGIALIVMIEFVFPFISKLNI
jgi:hypothetical protein